MIGNGWSRRELLTRAGFDSVTPLFRGLWYASSLERRDVA
jgi:hypothetical protein